MTSPKTYHYVDPTPCTRWLQYSAGACIITSLINFGYLSKGMYLLYTHNYTPYVSLRRILEQVVSIERIGRIAHIATILLVLMWTYRASANMHAFRPDPAEPYYATPGETILDYFIPLFNLIHPPLFMREIWTNSLQLTADRRANKRYLAFLWWWAFMAFALLQLIAKHKTEQHWMDTPEAAKSPLIPLTLSHIPYLISACLLIYLTRTISQAQEAYAAANNILSYADTPARAR